MKKLNAIFVILISFLLFTVKFEDFNRYYPSKINIPIMNYVANHEHSNEVYLYIDINSVDDKEQLILDFVKEVNFPAALNQREDPITTDLLVYRWFIYGRIDQLLYGLDTITSVDDNEDYFITNDKDDESGTHLIRYLDKKHYNLSSNIHIKLEFLPIEKLNNLEDSVAIAFLVEDDDLDLFFNKVDLALNDNLRISNTRITNHDLYSPDNIERGLYYYFELTQTNTVYIDRYLASFIVFGN